MPLKVLPKVDKKNDPIKELLIIGAGPHALTLLLRLLEPDPDMLSDKMRHEKAETTKNTRPIREVYNHIKDLSRGPKATLKIKKKKSNRDESLLQEVPPPLDLRTVLDSTQIVDAHGDWMASWKKHFEAIGISQLRSLMNAHADPFDHRSLEYYAEVNRRGEELITLKELTQRDDEFRGPYQVPSTKLFHDFHEALVQSYGIKDVVQKGKVLCITPMKDSTNDENLFEVTICDDTKGIVTVRTRRCVCALGPSFSQCEYSWKKALRSQLGENYDQVSRRILRPDDIVQWLLSNSKKEDADNNPTESRGRDGKRLLVVGGGITSAQLVLHAIKGPYWKSVFFIQRSQTLLKHFDVENKWMGPKRGKILESFFSQDMEGRSELLKEARKGGSMPPELLKELQNQEKKNPYLLCREEIEISCVDWIDDEFHVSFSDDSSAEVDYIWLATGCENVIDRYPVLDKLREVLPIDVVKGLPVLSQDLSWTSPSNVETDESQWKCLARKRIWCMGSLAGLQLGADALNIVGARHGAVKIANAIRNDMREV